jgi:hypothetical protein
MRSCYLVWQLDVQHDLPVQLVPITTKAVSSNWHGVHDTTLCDKVCQ